MQLSGKSAIITGAGFGIGRAVAVEFAREGAFIVITDRNQSGVEETAHLVRTEVPDARVCVLSGDLLDAGLALHLVELCLSESGRVDILVNNAADQTVATLARETDEHWERVITVNVTAMMRLARAAEPHLKSGAAIVNMSSLTGNVALPGRLAYNTSKTAIIGLTRALAVELGPRNIRANAILPGHIMSVGEEVWKERISERDQKIFPTTYALYRVGHPREVARAAVFLASEEASFITGHCLAVDGGGGILNPEEAIFRTAALFDGGTPTATPDSDDWKPNATGN
jgi:NAD(P)-dependent dehydrogenase (short-subunit alcohol dehydrogenase family)